MFGRVPDRARQYCQNMYFLKKQTPKICIFGKKILPKYVIYSLIPRLGHYIGIGGRYIEINIVNALFMRQYESVHSSDRGADREDNDVRFAGGKYMTA